MIRRIFDAASRINLACRREIAAKALAECTQHSWLADRAALERLQDDWTAPDGGPLPWQHSYEPTARAS